MKKRPKTRVKVEKILYFITIQNFKLDPDPDPEEIIPDPQHCFFGQAPPKPCQNHH